MTEIDETYDSKTRRDCDFLKLSEVQILSHHNKLRILAFNGSHH